jgi:hypothetical protein
VATGAQRWGRAREAGRGRGGAGEGWHGSGILGVAFIDSGEDTGGAVGERKGRHQWRPVVGAFKTIIYEARTTSGRGCDEADDSGRPAHMEEGSAMAVAAASREGGGGLAYARRKEKRERASAGPKGRSGPPEPLGLERAVGRTRPKWPRRSWAGEGGKMDQASREFRPKLIWAA